MENYRCETRRLDNRTQRVRVLVEDGHLSFDDVLQGWSAGAAMTGFFSRMIAEAPFEALYWEMPPLSRDRLERAYECVLIDSPELARRAANPAPFAEHFEGNEDVVVFPSLGADAMLIAPKPAPANASFPHLAAFCRTAPPELSSRFWQRMGEVALHRISDTPTWISTAGLGVIWLHARLDSRPKYYSHTPYRQWPGLAGETDA